MKQILTNTLNGYDVEERPAFNSDALFRVMSVMALAEGQVIDIIEPNGHAQVMTYNPSRSPQNYVATLTGYSILEDETGAQVIFQVSALYGTITEGTYYVYYNGRMAKVALLDNQEKIGVDGWAEYFLESIDSGILRSDALVTAHLLNTAVIDMHLDWGGLIRRTPINSNSDLFNDIDARVKAAIKGDTYTTWREIRPTGINATYHNANGSTIISFDTGVICTAVDSIYAPEYINIVMEDHEARLYLNIDNIPFYCLPSYLLHPGQYLHNTSTDYRAEAVLLCSMGEFIVQIEGDVGELISDEYPAVIYHGGAVYDVSIKNIIAPEGPGDTMVYLNDTDLPVGEVYFQQSTYTYADGALFAQEGEEADYRTPNKARMFILRGSIEYSESPYIPDSSDAVQTISSVEYVYRDEAAYDGLFATYALAHYEIDVGSKPYQETGDVNYDSVEGMRHIGHYGRNSHYAYVVDAPIGISHGEMVKFAVPIYRRERATLVSVIDDGDFSISGNSLEIDIGNMRTNKDDGIVSGYADYNAGDGFYYYRIDMMPAQAVANVMINKIYISDNFTSGGDIIGNVYAHETDAGYVCSMQEDEVPRVTDGAIDAGSDIIELSVALAHTETNYQILIDEEIITGTSSENGLSLVNLIRGAHNTRPAFHAAGSEVIAMHPYFVNAYAGKIDELGEGDITINIPASGFILPDSGYIRIHSEIIEYSVSVITESYAKINLIARRGYGSEPVELATGMPVAHISYFRYADIHPAAIPVCEYAGKYRPRLTLPLNYPDDPVRYGAKAVYLVELKNEASR